MKDPQTNTTYTINTQYIYIYIYIYIHQTNLGGCEGPELPRLPRLWLPPGPRGLKALGDGDLNYSILCIIIVSYHILYYCILLYHITYYITHWIVLYYIGGPQDRGAFRGRRSPSACRVRDGAP